MNLLMKGAVKMMLSNQFGAVYSRFVTSLSDEQRQMLLQVVNDLGSAFATRQQLEDLKAAGSQFELSNLSDVLELADSLGIIDKVGAKMAPGPTAVHSGMKGLCRCPSCKKLVFFEEMHNEA